MSGCERLYLLNRANGQNIFCYGKTDVIACELHAVDSARLMLVGRAGVMGQYAYGSLLLILGQKLKQGRREIHFQ